MNEEASEADGEGTCGGDIMVNEDGADGGGEPCSDGSPARHLPAAVGAGSGGVGKSNNLLARIAVWDVMVEKAVALGLQHPKQRRQQRRQQRGRRRRAKRGDDDEDKWDEEDDEGLERVKAVLAEVEAVLGEFKCLMDTCLDQITEDDEDHVRGGSSPWLCLGPELSRAFDKPFKARWRVKDPRRIPEIYRPFLSPGKRRPSSPPAAKLAERLPSVPVAVKLEEGGPDIVVQGQMPDEKGSELVARVSPPGLDQAIIEELLNNLDVPQVPKDEGNEVEDEGEDDENDKNDDDDDNDDGDFIESGGKGSVKKSKNTCTKCTRRYKCRRNLRRHLKICNGVPPSTAKPTWGKDPDTGRLFCTFPGCNSGKTWTCSSGVWKHYDSVHADLTDQFYAVYGCDLCEDRFPTKTMLNEHRKQKHTSLYKHSCPVCGQKVQSSDKLRQHMRQHTGEKPYQCGLCDYRCATRPAMNQHTFRKHESSLNRVFQRHVCEVCGKSFKARAHLKEHLVSHSEVRPFLCGICGKALKNKQCLNRHLFTHGVKHTCSVCGKHFASPRSLSVHLRDKHDLNLSVNPNMLPPETGVGSPQASD